MKLNKILLITAVIAGVSLNSCKKGCDDQTANNYDSSAKKDDGSCVYNPIITLNGSAAVTVNLGDAYVELGATASSAGGETVQVTVDNSSVNTAVAGVYTVTYTAEYKGDATTATRTVTVAVNQSLFLADWNCSSDCGTTVFPVDGNRTISAGATASEFNIDGFFTLLGGTVVGNFSGMTVTIPNQIITVTGGTIEVSGTGTLDGSGDSFTINYSYDNTIPFLGGTGTCTATYTRQ
jgi:hypothetical protein